MHLSLDLDGTIIDSMRSTADAFAISCQSLGIDFYPEKLNGQPLTVIIDELVLNDDDLKIKLKTNFISVYDDTLCMDCSLYPGVKNAIPQLYKMTKSLTLVTNKRRTPTLKILNHFGLTDYFESIIGVDDTGYGGSKKDKLKHIFKDNMQNIYVGDTKSDHRDSIEANYKFLYASWGYEQFVTENTLFSFKDIGNFLR